MLIKLNIGAGRNLLPTEDGWINIDAIQWDDRIQLVIDLEKNDLPYDDDSVDEIYMADFLEHLCRDRQLPFLQDVFRVMKKGAKFFMQLPDMGTAAERYCGTLENPSELQYDIDGAKLAEITYGGQDYEYNYHKWGYDQDSLRRTLQELGFSIWRLNSDGGMNMHCFGAKPFTKVLIPIGGGLGDIFQTYLASPSSARVYEELNIPEDEFPTSNAGVSMWLKRLRALKVAYPNIYIKAVVTSSNPAAVAFIAENPYFDEVEEVDFRETRKAGYWYNYEEDDFRCITRAEYLIETFDPDPVEFYTDAEQQELVDLLKSDTESPYIVLQPTAGVVEREPIDFNAYLDIAHIIVEELNYRVVILGERHTRTCVDRGVIDLRGQTSASASMQIALNAKGFVGTHSCIVLCAWYSRIPSVCIVPPTHDGGDLAWEEFFSGDHSPTIWGAHKSFNRTIIVDEDRRFDTSLVVSALRDMGL